MYGDADNSGLARDEELIALLRNLGMATTANSSLAELENQATESPELKRYFTSLQNKRDRGNLTEQEKTNFEALNFAFTQQSELDKRQSTFGISASLDEKYRDIQFVSDINKIPSVATGAKSSKVVTAEDVKSGREQKALLGAQVVVDKNNKKTYYFSLTKKTITDTTQHTENGGQNVVPIKPKIETKPLTGGSRSAGSGKALKPAKQIDLWYSSDYKKLYDTEIEEMSLQLLAIADTMLSNYDYKTIDSLPDSRVNITYESDSSVAGFDYVDELPLSTYQVSPLVANKSYLIYDETILKIKELLDPNINKSYLSLINCFGHYKTGQSSMTKGLPLYENGKATYDLEIDLIDVDGVLGYEVYLIAEGDTI